MLALLNRGRRTLSAATGTARLLLALAEQYLSFVGIPISEHFANLVSDITKVLHNTVGKKLKCIKDRVDALVLELQYSQTNALERRGGRKVSRGLCEVTHVRERGRLAAAAIKIACGHLDRGCNDRGRERPHSRLRVTLLEATRSLVATVIDEGLEPGADDGEEAGVGTTSSKITTGKLRLALFRMMNLRRSKASSVEKSLSHQEQQVKIDEVRRRLGPLANRFPSFCSDASVLRYLHARNWDVEKSSKLLKETLKWRLEYKPEAIRWEDIAQEAETGKIYRANYLDKYGRTVLVMRPGFQNTSSSKGQIRYLVYCMENAILNLSADQEQMVWLIDFHGWTMASVSVKVTRETAHVLQDYYPERLALGILYNPPKIFESFWKIVKPFLDQKTYKKVKFVYSDDPNSQKIMMELFDFDKLETSFGGHNQVEFNFNKYAELMKEDDKKYVSVAPMLKSSTPEALSPPALNSTSSSDSKSSKPVHEV
ncbi:hypothetical protein ZIOFF_030007 [Zingiber officinale]|uniref:CRAL-TRIO domain-containing protein n=2 Tax=Zingiber officinale TaxID=94328 RepID=A0A8J5GUQ4_ZINOF|nr:hypothetical protein ZIOFF_030007 [Zingiber officinale]